MQVKFLEGLKAKYQRLSNWLPLVQLLTFLLNEALVSSMALNGIKILTHPDEVRISLSYFPQTDPKKKVFSYLEDSAVLAVISKTGISSSQQSNKNIQSNEKSQGVNIDDDIFEKELKAYIRKSEPLEGSCKKYFKNFFCDYGLSPSMRRWLWRERIGNPIRMNRTTFNTWCNRTQHLGICGDQEAVIKADLIRACTCLEEDEDKVRIFSDLEKLISTFVVGSSD